MIKYVPNALSASRFALAAAWIALVTAGISGRVPYVALVTAALLTDLLDGRMARRFEAVSAIGRWLDALADVTFVLTALICAAVRGAIPYYIPALIGASFTQYAIDSMLIARAGAGPIRSRLGHLGGILNYVMVVVLAVTPPPAPIGIALRAICPAIAVFYLAAIIERAWLLYRTR